MEHYNAFLSPLIPICYFFLNFPFFFFFTISWVLFVRLLYWLNFVLVQLNIIAFVSIIFHFLFSSLLMSFFLWWMCCSFYYACSIFFFFGRFCYVFRLKGLWFYALWFANVGFYCIWLIAIAVANNILDAWV